MACILGHSFSFWLGFKGGKGVATSLGVFFGLLPLPSLGAFLLWALIFKTTGYVSLASIIAAIALPSFGVVAQMLGWGCGWPAVCFAGLAAVLVVVRHRANIQRLRAGTENRFQKKKS
jgi:glycerol-3-phosphate acyltransferase PlsY